MLTRQRNSRLFTYYSLNMIDAGPFIETGKKVPAGEKVNS